MKKTLLILGILTVLLFGASYSKSKLFPTKALLTTYKEGDLIFQTSLSNQSKAIQLATKSEYSHCGLLFTENEKWYVFEAIQPVKKTPLKDWISKGKDGKYVIKRLKEDKILANLEVVTKMKRICKSFQGKNYDLGFDWSDDRIYCSELIYKVYDRGAGIKIGKLERLKDFDLSNSLVQKKLRERYGKNIPMEEVVISPVSIFESKLLYTVNEK
jgi:hypothetical protein